MSFKFGLIEYFNFGKDLYQYFLSKPTYRSPLSRRTLEGFGRQWILAVEFVYSLDYQSNQMNFGSIYDLSNEESDVRSNIWKIIAGI